jgi:hypothetical protein
MRKAAAGSALGVILLLSACSNGAAAERQVSSAQSSALEAQSWTIAQAAKQYETMINPSNVDANALAELGPTDSLADYQAALSLLGNDAGLFAASLLAGNWPAAIRPLIADLIPAVQTEQDAVQAAITAGSVAKVRAQLTTSQSAIAAAKAKSAAVRAALGLTGS